MQGHPTAEQQRAALCSRTAQVSPQRLPAAQHFKHYFDTRSHEGVELDRVKVAVGAGEHRAVQALRQWRENRGSGCCDAQCALGDLALKLPHSC